MEWNHDSTRITDDKPIYPPGTLVRLNTYQYRFLCGKSSVPHSGKIAHVHPDEVAGSYPIAMILEIDNLETYYKVLLASKSYWFQVSGTMLADRPAS